MSSDHLILQLAELGLSDLEARTYVALLVAGPATAYSIGRAIERPTANVYKAADALEARGAIVSSAGAKRVLQAVPPEEFLAHVRRRQGDLLDTVGEGLRKLNAAPAKAGLYQLENVDAVFERARRMLGEATVIAVVDAFPQVVERLKKDIEAATDRGVEVYVEVYAPASVRCTSLVEVPGGAEIVSHWRSAQLNVITDARELLLALCTADMARVIEAYWSNSVYLACTQQAGFLREHAFHQIRHVVEAGLVTEERVRGILDRNPRFGTLEMPGQRLLVERVRHMEGGSS